MKSCSTLLVALGLVSSTVLAQSVQPVPQQPASGSMSESGTATPPAGSGQMPPPTMGSGSQGTSATENGGTESSGASGMQSSASSGQLITPDIAQSRPAADTSRIAITPRTENGVTYMCGGVGDDESAYMKQTAAKDYDLMMTFAERTGSYVANVDVSIKDARGRTVLETTCDAPIMLVDLPSGGNYRIHADAGGRAIDRSAAVKSGKGQARQVTFVWPADTAAASSMGSDARGGESSGAGSYGTESSGSEKD